MFRTSLSLPLRGKAYAHTFKQSPFTLINKMQISECTVSECTLRHIYSFYTCRQMLSDWYSMAPEDVSLEKFVKILKSEDLENLRAFAYELEEVIDE